MGYVIEVHDLSKSYGDVKALDSLSFSVSDRTILGVIGPNGAGKTTLIRILSCLLKPDRGSVAIYGHEIGSQCGDEVRRLFAVLPQDVRGPFLHVNAFRVYLSLSPYEGLFEGGGEG